ncbi:hypothetical protein B6S12_08825 [Helicobacter valdiviensis]|uniref:Uncharacterized protein n=1 Tax=Helicobacter valdiviensis TaxID=1458358 RepID=A0A2W6MSL9_9HELI|nr:hypothetical protein [Helicobacter valdiviensis]PZT47487.1 hypothetical protein B6S12_08825 [Helicobacter valdiviensis]
MKKAISLQYFVFLLQNEKVFCEEKLEEFSKRKYKKLAFLIKKRLDIPLELAFRMLFYPNYTLNIELSFSVYKEKQDRYLTKKPNFFKRILKHFSTHKITISNQKLLLDDELINDDLAQKIWLIL